MMSPRSDRACSLPNSSPPDKPDAFTVAAQTIPAARAGDPAPPGVSGYEILGELGRGGMGVVYKARHTKLNRIVALKMILSGQCAGALELARFRREGETLAELQHPNIVRVFEVGECDGRPFLVLEYVAGGSLARRTAGVPQPPREAAALVETLARAIHHAHTQDIIHRDLTPGNVLLSEAGVPLITDFGLARHTAEDTRLTASGAVLGTPGYLAPEQASGRDFLGPHTDIHALGAILYDLLTGRPPFAAESVMEVLAQTIEREPVPPRRLCRAVPRDLETICLKCLAKEPHKRYASAAELADDLRRFLSGHPIKARPVGVPERVWRWARRHPTGAALVGVVTALLSVMLAGAVWYNVRLGHALEQSRDSERARREQLLDALLSEARSKCWSRRPGQRFDTLATVRQAAELARELDRPEATFTELRNLAASALALADMRTLHEWDAPPEGVSILAIDPATLAQYARGDTKGNLSIRRFVGDEEVAALPGKGKPRSLTFGHQPETAYFHDQADGGLYFWRFGEAPVKVATLDGNVYGFQWDRGGDRLLLRRLTADNTSDFWVFDRPTARLFRVIRTDTWPAATLSPDGRRLAVVPGPYNSPQRRNVLIIDVDSGRELARLCHEGHVLEPKWHPDSITLAVGDYDNHSVHVWDTVEARRLRVLRDLRGGAIHLGQSQSGQVLAGSSEWGAGATLWHPHTGAMLLRAIDELMVPIHATPDGRLFGFRRIGDRYRLTVIEPSPFLRTVAPLTKDGSPAETRYVSIHPNGRLLAAGTTAGVYLYDLPSGEKRGHIDSGSTKFVRFDPSGGDLYTSGIAGLVRWPVRAEKGNLDPLTVGPPQRLRAPVGHDFHLDISPDGKTVAVAESSQVAVLREGRLPLVLGPRVDTRELRVSPDGRWLSATRLASGTVQVYDLSRGGPPVKTGLSGMVFRPDGGWVTDGRRRWRVGSWEEDSPLEVGANTHQPTYSRDGQSFAAGRSGGLLVLGDAATGRDHVTIEAPDAGRVHYVDFSPDKATLAQGAVDQMVVHLWDLRALRKHLAEMGLDWDEPPYPDAPPAAPPLRVTIDGAKLLGDPVTYDQRTRADLRAALARDSGNVEALVRLGGMDRLAGRPDDAIVHLDAALRLRPDHEIARSHRGWAQWERGRPAEALADADALLKADPRLIDALVLRSEALGELGRYADAIDAVDRVLAIEPANLEWYRRADWHEKLGQPEQARADRVKAELLLDRWTLADLTSRAWAMATGQKGYYPSRRSTFGAAHLIRRAQKVAPGDPLVVMLLGVVQYRQSDYARAEGTLRRALTCELSPANRVRGLLFLSRCYARRGHPAEAQGRLDEAKTLVGTMDVSPILRSELAWLTHETGEELRPAGR